jgi:undecaprenyl diphosphate synthase
LADTKARPITIEPIAKLPSHVAIIMDGNGRWAAKRGLPRLSGHQAGTENLRRVIRASVEFGLKYLTIYAFSTENWGRPKEEVEGLLHILADVIDRELRELNEEGVQLRHIGHLEALPESLRNKVQKAIDMTRNNQRLTLSLAFNYGGRDELVCAIRDIVVEGLRPEEITPEVVSKHLFTSGIPDPDLIIRTSGEMRISNFLIWQGAYAEWYSTPTLWPDFGREELYLALVEYSQRDRRYGRLSQDSATPT